MVYVQTFCSIRQIDPKVHNYVIVLRMILFSFIQITDSERYVKL
jgi:hypothetical protein